MIRKFSYCYWELRYRLRKWLWDRSVKKSKINGMALMYHHVSDMHIDTNESCQCSTAEFINTLLQIKADQRQFVSVDTMMNIIKEKQTIKFAVVTFDDVPENFYTNAYPFLKQEKIPFILFITTSFIDKLGYLSKEQLIEIDRDPLCTIGAHTLTHPMLRNVDNIKEELVKSKALLEEIVDHTVDFMAYPYGRQSSVSKRVMREAKEAGYKCSFGTIQSPITDVSAKNLYYLPRIVKK